jgi:hypothetical protein
LSTKKMKESQNICPLSSFFLFSTMKLFNSFLALALSATASAALLHDSAASMTPQILPCAAVAALRASFSSPSPSFPSSCSRARCELSLVSLAAGAAASSSSSSFSSSSAPLRNGINAVSLSGMEPGVWEASAACGRGYSVAVVPAAVGGGGGEKVSTSPSLSPSPSSTSRFHFFVQHCNETLLQSMVEMKSQFVVAAARNEAGKGKGKSGLSSPSSSSAAAAAAARGVRVAAATAALAASQVGLVALAVA